MKLSFVSEKFWLSLTFSKVITYAYGATTMFHSLAEIQFVSSDIVLTADYYENLLVLVNITDGTGDGIGLGRKTNIKPYKKIINNSRSCSKRKKN